MPCQHSTGEAIGLIINFQSMVSEFLPCVIMDPPLQNLLQICRHQISIRITEENDLHRKVKKQCCPVHIVLIDYRCKVTLLATCKIITSSFNPLVSMSVIILLLVVVYCLKQQYKGCVFNEDIAGAIGSCKVFLKNVQHHKFVIISKPFLCYCLFHMSLPNKKIQLI